MSTVLIVSPYFPPATLAGVHRARHLAKHLPKFGWSPIIIRAGEEHYTETLDPELARLVPPSVVQIRTKAFPSRLARRFGVGDMGLRAFFPIMNAIKRASLACNPKVVLITGSPYYPMILTSWIWNELKIPVVLDFQDPWVSAEGAQQRAWSKSWLSHQLAVLLEPIALRHASFVTSVSRTQNIQLANRYPWLDRSKMADIPIGGDPEDFLALLEASRRSEGESNCAERPFEFKYIGTVTNRFSPLFEEFFLGVKQLFKHHPSMESKVRFRFIGTSNQPGEFHKLQVKPIADRIGLGHVVSEDPARIPYLAALQQVSTADALLMVGSDEPHYTASRIYTNLMANHPFISLFHQESSAHEILSAAGGGVAIPFVAGNSNATVSAIADAIDRMVAAPNSFGTIKSEAYSAYSAERIAEKFANIFDRL